MKILTALRLCTLGKYEIYLMIMAASTQTKINKKIKLKSTQSKLKCENALFKLYYKKTVSEKTYCMLKYH
jgi:hypothetical protein